MSIVTSGEQIDLLRTGAEPWNRWRSTHPHVAVDLAGADLRGLSLQGVDLKSANLEGANLSGCDLTGAHLGSAELRRANFSHALLVRAHMAHVKARRAVFAFADLSHSILVFADLRNTDLRAATLTHALLEDVSLQRANLSHAHLQGTVLAAADCTGAVFTGANLTGTNLTNAVFRETIVNSVQWDQGLFWSILKQSVAKPVDIWRRRHDLILDTTMRCKGIDIGSCHGNQHLRRFLQDQDYLEEKLDGRGKYVCVLWWLSSDCGRSLGRWTIWCMLIALIFAVIYTSLGSRHFSSDYLPFGMHTMLYYSLVTFTTLGFGDIAPKTNLAAAIVMVEVVLGYIMLGGLIAIFSGRLARRGG